MSSNTEDSKITFFSDLALNGAQDFQEDEATYLDGVMGGVYQDSSSSAITATTTTTTTATQAASSNSSYQLGFEKYSQMMNMTLELVQDMTTVKEGDTVWTAYGKGICIYKPRSVAAGQGVAAVSPPSMQVALSFGTLFHRQPEMIHKLFTEQQYQQAMDHLEQVRKIQWTFQCEQWNVNIMGNEDECVPCLFEKPYWKGGGNSNSGTTRATKRINKMKKPTSTSSKSSSSASWFRRTSSSSNNNKNKNASCLYKTCDVCGNPVCSNHTVGNQQQYFTMCVDCQFDLTHILIQTPTNDDGTSNNNNANNPSNSSSPRLQLLDPNHPQLAQTLDKLLQYYTRMVIQLSFFVPTSSKDLAYALTQNEKRASQVQLGTGSLSFVGAALGVAGACSLLTPAGPAILLAAVATSASSAAIQGTHAGYHRFVKGTTHTQLHTMVDRILGWHGLCLGILNALDELRERMLQEHQKVLHVLTEQQKLREQFVAANKKSSTSTTTKSTSEMKWQSNNNNNNKYLSTTSRRNARGMKQANTASSNKALDVWNTLAMGGFHTTRHGLTGVGLTSAMGASYSQMINASIQTVPVVGAVFSAGCMAMDASNIATTLNRLQKPSEKAMALYHVQDSFSLQIPSTIQLEIEALLNALHDLRQQQEDAQQNQQQDLIEQELEELNYL